MTTPKERGFYMALIGSCWGVGAILGPVVGGAFAVSPATWRWAFYINLVIFAVSAPAYVFFLPAIYPSQGINVRERLASLDFVGYVLGAGTWVGFLLAISMDFLSLVKIKEETKKEADKLMIKKIIMYENKLIKQKE